MGPNEEGPRTRSGDKAAATANLSNARTGLAQYYAGLSAVVTHKDLIEKRYKDKLEWFQKHFVSFKRSFYLDIRLTNTFQLQDHEYEGITILPPTLEQEIDIYCSVRGSANRDNLDTHHRHRTQASFGFKAQEKLIEPGVLKSAIDRLRSLGYNQPAVFRQDLFEQMLESVS